VMGDSHAGTFTPAFVAMARAESFTLAIATLGNCPWQQGVVEAPVDAATDIDRKCRGHQNDWYRRVVPQFDPDIVVLVHRTLDDPTTPSYIRLPDNRRVLANLPDSERALQAVAAKTLAQLRKRGRKIVIFEPLPTAPGTFNPFDCLSKESSVDACRYVARASPSRLERYYRQAANGSDVFTLDLDRLVCPYLPICDPIVGGVVVKRDSQHITAGFSQKLAAPIQSLLASDGIVGRPQ